MHNPLTNRAFRCKRRKGFTLVEIMIVVVIIGILATIAIPAFRKVQLNSRASIIANDFRIFGDALNQYNLERGAWPPADWVQGAYPAGMDGYMPNAWTENAAVGGYYVFDFTDGNPTVILMKSGLKQDLLARVEEIMDDGDPADGMVRSSGTSIDYILP